MPDGWTVTPRPDGVVVTGPEDGLVLHLVEAGPGDVDGAVTAAWASRQPGFARGLRSRNEAPGRNGWTTFSNLHYRTAPDEERAVVAAVATAPTQALVLLIDVSTAAWARHVSDVSLMLQTITAAGYVPEDYAEKTPRALGEADFAALRALLEQGMAAADVPGVTVALFDARGPLYAVTLGVRDRARPEPVGPETRFLVASMTKPLTTLMLARLVAAERFAWDTPVTAVHPGFRLADDALTRQVQMRHLVCACTGLPRHDLEWIFGFHRSSPARELARLGAVQPTTAFGAQFQYSNEMAAAAGYVGAHALDPGAEPGAAYDAAMQTHVFGPLGMTRTTFDFDAARAGDYAAPHGFDLDQKNAPVDFDINRAIVPLRPAGGAWSTLGDLGRYVQLELAEGRLPDGGAYITRDPLLARRREQVAIGQEMSYGMGLLTERHRGVEIIGHDGSMFGYRSDLFFVPHAGVGGVVLANADSGGALTRTVRYWVLERMYDGSPRAEALMMALGRIYRDDHAAARALWTVPPAPELTARLADRYHAEALGSLTVERGPDEVAFVFDGWRSAVGTTTETDGSISFVTTDPGVRRWTFAADNADGPIAALTLRDAQHSYVFTAEGARPPATADPGPER